MYRDQPRSRHRVNLGTDHSICESGFDVVETSPLERGADQQYTSGTIQYVKNGQILATVDFGSGTEDDQAHANTNGEEFDFCLKGNDYGKKDKYDLGKGWLKKKKSKKEKKAIDEAYEKMISKKSRRS